MAMSAMVFVAAAHAVLTAQASPAAQPAPELRLLALIWRATLAGKIVMAILLILSIAVWAVIISRFLQWRRVDRTDLAFIRNYHRENDEVGIMRAARNHDESGLARVFRDLFQQHQGWGHISEIGGDTWRSVMLGTLGRTVHDVMEPLDKTLGLLATTAGAAPFIGLFGTVIGIIVAFENIGQYRTADLSVVAPGIAEALVATAAGLAAAIPALLAYNYFSHKNRKYRQELRDFGTYLVDQWALNSRLQARSSAQSSSAGRRLAGSGTPSGAPS